MNRSLSGFLQSKFNIYICRAIGWTLARTYVRLLGSLYLRFRRKENRVISDNIGTVFANAEGEHARYRLCSAVTAGIATHYYEKLFNAYCTEQASRRFFATRVVNEGLDPIRECLSEGRGVLLVTGHYGGVEFIPGYLGAAGIANAIVVRFASDRLRKLSREKGARFSIRIIDADRSPNVFFTICRHLRRNRVVVIQCDEIEAWKPSEKRRIVFLGREMAPDRSLALLARRSGSPVIFGVMHRDPDFRYRFVARKAPQDAFCSPEAIAEAGLKFIEELVYRHPEQWYQWNKLPVIGRPRACTPAPLWQTPETSWIAGLGEAS